MSESESSGDSGCGGCGCFGGMFSAGGVVAFIISWKLFHAFWWAVFAAFFGWGYVVYALIYYLPQIKLMLG